jgi:hypothetical protein
VTFPMNQKFKTYIFSALLAGLVSVRIRRRLAVQRLGLGIGGGKINERKAIMKNPIRFVSALLVRLGDSSSAVRRQRWPQVRFQSAHI